MTQPTAVRESNREVSRSLLAHHQAKELVSEAHGHAGGSHNLSRPCSWRRRFSAPLVQLRN